jgi:hypothetical protein
MYSLVLDINELRNIYGKDDLTYDDLGFGSENSYDADTTSYTFNAILIYYSIFDANKNDVLATNLYGIYILNNAVANINNFEFPSLIKERTSQHKTGTSFSFRLNIKPTSAYSGDVEIIDNSTASYGMSEDFNDVLHNLNSAIRTLTNNAKTMYEISQGNKSLRDLTSSALEKVEELEKTINNIKQQSNKNDAIHLKSPFPATNSYNNIKKESIKKALGALDFDFDFHNNKTSLTPNETIISNLDEDSQRICKSLYTYVDGCYYFDIFKLLSLLVALNK